MTPRDTSTLHAFAISLPRGGPGVLHVHAFSASTPPLQPSWSCTRRDRFGQTDPRSPATLPLCTPLSGLGPPCRAKSPRCVLASWLCLVVNVNHRAHVGARTGHWADASPCLATLAHPWTWSATPPLHHHHTHRFARPLLQRGRPCWWCPPWMTLRGCSTFEGRTWSTIPCGAWEESIAPTLSHFPPFKSCCFVSHNPPIRSVHFLMHAKTRLREGYLPVPRQRCV